MKLNSLALVVCVLAAGAAMGADINVAALGERSKIHHRDVPHKVLAFYYPWYGNAQVVGGSGRSAHWSGIDESAKSIATSTHYPKLGPYDSHDPKLIARHVRWAKDSGIDGFIVSWWGKGTFEDRALGPVLDACRRAGIEASVYYEAVPDPNNLRTAVDDILYVLRRYGRHPAWLRIDGKPVLFVYGRAVDQIGLAGWLRVITDVNREFPGKAVFIGDQIGRGSARVFDGIHTYNTAGNLQRRDAADVGRWARETFPQWVETADSLSRISTLTLIPGYDDTKIRKPGLRIERFDGESYKAQWEAAIAAQPDWVLLTSFNEWHEGSEIEPSEENGDFYLRLTAQFTMRFKATKKPPKQDARPTANRIDAAEQATLRRRLMEKRITLLPDFDLALTWPLLEWGVPLTSITWEQVAGLDAASVKEMPVLVSASHERYRQSIHRQGDVDQGIRRYLEAGGLLVVLPTGPMPFHYNEEGKTVASSARFGIPLSVAGPDGGWEEPPAGRTLEFIPAGDALPHFKRPFPFPASGDRRWRPFVLSQLSKEDVVVPLLELKDAQGRSYGHAAAYVEHKSSAPRGGRVLYAWFGLFDMPESESLVHDLFGFVSDRLGN